MRKPLGWIRLPSLPAPDVWHARTGLTLYPVGPRSTVTVVLSVAGLRPGDVAGVALFHRPFAWLGVERDSDGVTLVQFDERSDTTSRAPLGGRRVWLRADCDFLRNEVGFRYSTDGSSFAEIGRSHAVSNGQAAAHGIPCSLFSCCTTLRDTGGHADFDSFVLTTEHAGHLAQGHGNGGPAVGPGFRRQPAPSSPSGRVRDR
jgi:xylan 1,4-beta-xylosidase